MIAIKRNTGRTSRMLREAARLALAGQNVIVIASTHAQAHELWRKTWDVGYPGIEAHVGNLTVTFNNGKTIKFKRASDPFISWETGVVEGEQAVVLVDHFAIEQKWGWVLEMWLKFSPHNLSISTVGAN
jgi:hypothetical protein